MTKSSAKPNTTEKPKYDYFIPGVGIVRAESLAEALKQATKEEKVGDVNN